MIAPMSVFNRWPGSAPTGRWAAAALVALVALALVGCRFDEAGLPGSGRDAAGSADADLDVRDARLVEPDGASSDAAAPCTDHDGDDFYVAAGGADCGELLDCDDFDALAFPGQSEFFTEARVSGGFDYDCDGEETPELDTTAGGDCYWDWFTCEGSGWYGGVPACGTEGIWHVCSASGIECRESDANLQTMPCR